MATPSKVSNSSESDGAATRAGAAAAIADVLGRHESLDQAIATRIDAVLEGRERGQARALAYGALRWHLKHRRIIAELADKPLSTRDRRLEALLSIGLFQLLQPRQPEYAAVSATVEAARRLGLGRASGFVNAALRRFLRDRETLLRSADQTDEGRWSHPRWLIERLRKDWPERAAEIFAAALDHPPFWLRVNQSRVTRAEYRDLLHRQFGVETLAPDEFPDALRLSRALEVSRLPGFADGHASVQDAASQLAADLLAPEPGMRVLDACAAPGGKAAHLLERTRGELDLVAVDVDARRLARLEENLARAQFARVSIVNDDALHPDRWWDGRVFDRILIDAPCSATGVIRRHPDIHFLRRESDIGQMAATQLRLLRNLSGLLAPGGHLLYATCSVLCEENDDVVTAFLAEPDADTRCDLITLAMPAEVVRTAAGGAQCLPSAGGTDGVYYALMTRHSG